MAPERVSVVVPVWNNRALTRTFLDSLKSLPPRASYRLVVVDNGSEDGIQDDLREAAGRGELDLVRNAENLGYARATNQGIAVHPGSELVLLLNNDMIALPGWLDGLVEEMDAHPNADAVGSLLLYEDLRSIQHAGMTAGRVRGRITAIHRWQYRMLERTPQAETGGEVVAVTGASMLVRRSAFERVGTLSEGYLNGFEDLDLCWRIRRGGRTIRYTPRSRLVHLESRTPGRRNREEANRALFDEVWGTSPLETGEDFLADLRELRLRRRLEVEPGNPWALAGLRRIVDGREDGEAAELEARLASSPSSWLTKAAARVFA